jgi:hypothetical protein
VEATIRLSFDLHVNCPHCDETIDLMDNDYNDDGFFTRPIFENRWEDLKGEEITCFECEETFTIKDVEY